MEEVAPAPLAPMSVAPPAQPLAPMSVAPIAPSSEQLPAVVPKHCSECAAVKRLKGSTGDGLTAWHARPCVACATAQAAAAANVSMCMRSALKDDLRPRRLFDAPSENDADADLELELFPFAPMDDPESSTVPFRAESPAMRPPSALADPLSPSGPDATVDDSAHSATSPGEYLLCQPVEEEGMSPIVGHSPSVEQEMQSSESMVVAAPSPDVVEAPRGLAQMVPSLTLELPPEGSPDRANEAAPALSSPAMPPPPPLLHFSSVEAAAAARDNGSTSSYAVHSPSPALSFAAARIIQHDRVLMREHAGRCMPTPWIARSPSHGASSSCATPSRDAHALRPPTPGAPGSNVRRTTSFIDGLESEEGEDGDGVPVSMTDSVLMQLAQSLTSISLGSKRSIAERDL